MASKTVSVGSTVGLHARPAATIAARAAEFDAPVTLSISPGNPVDASSALLIMTLGAGKGAEVTVESESQEACDAIAELVEKNLDE